VLRQVAGDWGGSGAAVGREVFDHRPPRAASGRFGQQSAGDATTAMHNTQHGHGVICLGAPVDGNVG
jgi:hypothetical protein